MADTFTTLIGSLPYAPTTVNGTGLLPPLIRSIGHLLFALGATTETRCTVLTPEELKNEIVAASDHAGAISNAALDNLSRAAAAHLAAYKGAIAAAVRHWDQWTPEERSANLQQLAHRAAGIASFLDRELVGLGATETDPGNTL